LIATAVRTCCKWALDCYDRLRFWRIYGVFLPDEVLERVYRQNAERLLGIARKATDEGSTR
jgi:hypothetical protein